MGKDKTFIETLEANVALVKAELVRFRVRGMAFTGDAKDRHDKHVAQLELKVDKINSDLRNRNKAGKHLWRYWEERLQESWKELQADLRHAIIKSFQTEPSLTTLHGGDDYFRYDELIALLKK